MVFHNELWKYMTGSRKSVFPKHHVRWINFAHIQLRKNSLKRLRCKNTGTGEAERGPLLVKSACEWVKFKPSYWYKRAGIWDSDKGSPLPKMTVSSRGLRICECVIRGAGSYCGVLLTQQYILPKPLKYGVVCDGAKTRFEMSSYWSTRCKSETVWTR